MSKPLLFIDGDILAYRSAFSAEKQTNWGDGLWTWHANEDEAYGEATAWLACAVKQLNASGVCIAFTGKTNWRHEVLPSYKANRKETRKPLVLNALKARLMDNYPSELHEGIEADDLLGIWMGREPGNILCSLDKDLKQIPGLHCRTLEEGITTVTPEEGLRWHMTQTLTGDATDGYAGLPGCGPVGAAKILGDSTDPVVLWKAVAAAYAKKGLPASEAIIMARVSKILDCNHFKDGKPVLWVPPV